MKRYKSIFVALTAFFLASCGDTGGFAPSSRNDTSFLMAPIEPAIMQDENLLPAVY